MYLQNVYVKIRLIKENADARAVFYAASADALSEKILQFLTGDRKMKKILAVVLAAVMMAAAVVAFGACGGNGKETLYVYTNAAFAPWEYMNEYNEVVGVDVDIANEIGEVLGYNVEVRDVAFGSIFTEVQNNEMAIGLAGITVNAEREETGIFSDSYATSTQYAIIPDSMASSLVEGKLPVSALAGKKIGTQESTTGFFLIDEAVNGSTDEETGEHVKGELEGTDAKCYSYKNGIIAGQDLGTQIDVLVIDELPAKSIWNNKSGYQVVEVDAEPESYAVYLNKNATKLRDDINKVITALVDNGVIDYWLLKHSGAII